MTRTGAHAATARASAWLRIPLALLATTGLLTGCAQTERIESSGHDNAPETQPAPTDEAPTDEAPTDESPAPTEQLGTAPSAITCPGLMANDLLFSDKLIHSDSVAAWGLKEQVAVTGGTYAYPRYGTDRHEIPINRGLKCSVYGKSAEMSLHFDYLESPQAVAELEQLIDPAEFDERDAATGIPVLVQRTPSEGNFSFLVFGNGWAIVGDATMPDFVFEEVFSGEFREANPADYQTADAQTLGCSMFFGPQTDGDAATQVPLTQATTFSAISGENALTTTRGFAEPYHYEDVLCEEIVWHAGEAPDTAGLTEVSTPAHGTVYQRGERDYLVVFESGYAEVATSEDTAVKVREPGFYTFGD